MRQRGMIPVTLLLYGAAALVFMGALWGLYRWAYNNGAEAVRADWREAIERQTKLEQETIARAGEKKEKGDAKARTVYRTITRDVEKVVDRVEYRNVCIDADGLRLVNAALAGPDAPPAKPDKPVPEPRAAQ